MFFNVSPGTVEAQLTPPSSESCEALYACSTSTSNAGKALVTAGDVTTLIVRCQ